MGENSYIKKQIQVKAIQWDGKNEKEIFSFCKNCFIDGNQRLIVETLEGPMIAEIGDYIICGIKGEFYPCKPDIFEITYESL